MKIKKRLKLILSIIKNADYVDEMIKSYDDEVRIRVEEFLSNTFKNLDFTLENLRSKNEDMYLTSDACNNTVIMLKVDEPKYDFLINNEIPEANIMVDSISFQKRYIQFSQYISFFHSHNIAMYDLNDPQIRSNLYKPIMDFLVGNNLISIELYRSEIPDNDCIVYRLNYLEK